MMGLGYSDVKAHDEQVVTAEEFVARKSGPCQVIDCRTAREYEAGHVAGAENIPEEEIRTRLDEVATDGRNIFVYCLSGFRAYLTCRILQNRGVKNVFNVSGGWNSIKMVNQKE
jgi:rhodanese-related sulfurtransferase